MIDISVITIVRNRERHLARLIDGVAANKVHPRELIVVDMGSDSVALPTLPFAATRIAQPAYDVLRLAAARNRGADAAAGRHLLFLDVDCIPRSNLIAAMDEALCQADALICPEVRYLGPDAATTMDERALIVGSVRHPARQFPDAGLQPEPNAGLFWSLTFGIRRDRFTVLGGFDEGFEGYGAEDTDFGFRAAAAGLPLLFLGGTGSFHQHHGVISPPLQHLGDIVRNANRFHARWGVWPMDGWLNEFAAMGLVVFDGKTLRQLREPTPNEIAAAVQPASTYF